MPELTRVQREFRSAMASLPAAVNVVTTAGPAGKCGVTVSAVCSVTDSPPTVLVCVNRSSAMHDVFQKNGRLCVNVLSGDHEELALHFSGATKVSMEERFSWDIWAPTGDEMPILRDAQVNLVGRIADQSVIGSHSVLFVELDTILIRDGGEDSLVYFQRKFHRIASTDDDAVPGWQFYDEWSDPIAFSQYTGEAR